MKQGARSAADCLYSLDFDPSVPHGLHMAALPTMSGTKDLARVPRIQVCRPTNGPGRPILISHQHNRVRTGLDFAGAQSLGLCIEDYISLFSSLNPCGNFSGTSSLKFRGTKGSIGHTFMVCIHTENQNQGDFYPFILLEISVLNESPLGHLRYLLTDVPPQPNSPPDNVIGPGQTAKVLKSRKRAFTPSPASPNK
jgi:hypothetical protein